MKSLASELCLHLARRLKPGNARRESLVDRGMQMSSIANQRIKAGNKIKHILAWKVHTNIHARLLELAKEDNEIPRDTIYEAVDSRGSVGSLTSSSELNSSAYTSTTLSNRLCIKEDASNGCGGDSRSNKMAKISSDSMLSRAPTQVDTSIRKVDFSQMSEIRDSYILEGNESDSSDSSEST